MVDPKKMEATGICCIHNLSLQDLVAHDAKLKAFGLAIRCDRCRQKCRRGKNYLNEANQNPKVCWVFIVKFLLEVWFSEAFMGKNEKETHGDFS